MIRRCVCVQRRSIVRCNYETITDYINGSPRNCGRAAGSGRRDGSAGGNGSKIRNMTMIDERPPHLSSKPIVGNWEGDLIVGVGCQRP
jgi:IS30 family transposase